MVKNTPLNNSSDLRCLSREEKGGGKKEARGCIGVSGLRACRERLDAPIKHAVVMDKSHRLYIYIIIFFLNYSFGNYFTSDKRQLRA